MHSKRCGAESGPPARPLLARWGRDKLRAYRFWVRPMRVKTLTAFVDSSITRVCYNPLQESKDTNHPMDVAPIINSDLRHSKRNKWKCWQPTCVVSAPRLYAISRHAHGETWSIRPWCWRQYLPVDAYRKRGFHQIPLSLPVIR